MHVTAWILTWHIVIVTDRATPTPVSVGSRGWLHIEPPHRDREPHKPTDYCRGPTDYWTQP